MARTVKGPFLPVLLACALLAGCPAQYRRQADDVAYRIVKDEQKGALGKSEAFTIEPPSETLRRRLLEAQGLPYSGPASLGSDKLDRIKHWPEKEVSPTTAGDGEAGVTVPADAPLTLTLTDALQVAARNNRDYQTRKEDVFRAALALDLERNEFRYLFFSTPEATYSDDRGQDQRAVRGLVGSPDAKVTQKLKTGAEYSFQLAFDLAKLLTQNDASSLGMLADASISIPLLKGAGEHIVTEPLTQAQRDVVYALYSLERFRRTLAVRVASEYLGVLQQLDQVVNAEENYHSLSDGAKRARRLADAGRLPEVQVDQARQDELRARNRWISAQQAYAGRLDSFKTTLGLPTDANIKLDPSALEKLAEAAKRATAAETGYQPASQPASEPADQPASQPASGPADQPASQPASGPADQPTSQPASGPASQPASAPANQPAGGNGGSVLAEGPGGTKSPDQTSPGPLELQPDAAIRVALSERLDLRTAQGEVYDAQRQVVVAADALKAGLTLKGSGSTGASRGVGSADQPNAELLPQWGSYSASLLLDLPLERTAERNAYRNSFVALERAVRSVQDLEDQIKLEIRNALRALLEAREAASIQAQAVTLAQRRVESTKLFLQAGRAEIRDVLDAQEALVSAQDALSAALVDYRVSELELQRDMDVLEIDEKGLWREYQPPKDTAGK